ncbi:soma ferritin [Agrilus planipennis]|uniref:Ferritin n=1 Tax=Agrilus planipennis TaxID=224129 RepID=A0A1W4X7G0_AGRPL|nr:soma ferritin [Agrilus planipennis]
MKPLFLFIFGVIAVVTAQQNEYCYKSVVQACSHTTSKLSSDTLPECDAKYGAINEVVGDLQAFATTHISRSFEYLLMSTHYANYQKNRPGFEKLFRDLSDEKWAESIEIIKHIAKRGGRMNFRRWKTDERKQKQENYELYELESVAKALDMEKALALEAHTIHDAVSRRLEKAHDPEISSYIEEEFVHKLASNVRKLSGYASDIYSFLKTKDSSLALYLFDNYLQKSL